MAGRDFAGLDRTFLRFRITHGDHPRSTRFSRTFQCLAVPRQPLKLLETLNDTEKAGVGGSTPSLATIIPKDLDVFAQFLQPKVQPKIDHWVVSVRRWALFPSRSARNLPCASSLDSWSDCAYSCIVVLTSSWRRMPCTVFGSHFSFTSEEASEWRKLWKPNRTRWSSLMTPALTAAGRRYFCTMIEADNGFLPLSRMVLMVNAPSKPIFIRISHGCSVVVNDSPFLAPFITIEGRRDGKLEDCSMGATTKLTLEEFLQLPEEPGKRFELDRGELIVEPSPTFRHNAIRFRIARHLQDFVREHQLGHVTVENDFRLGPDIVRNPDVAFVATEALRRMNVDRSPIEGVPDLAIEVVSESNLAQDMLTKVHQYLDSGAKAVWVFYPNLKVVQIHDRQGTREIAAPASLEDKTVFRGQSYTLPLTPIFDEDITK